MTDGFFYIIVLIMSVVAHEFAHGYSAYLLGDNTARLSGRLTLNPIKHLDPFGSIILPLFLILSKAGFVIGWARPVPYNPNNVRNGRWGILTVAISGILVNILIAIFFGLVIRFLPLINLSIDIAPLLRISAIIVIVNLVLAFFNLIPIPPLDGSKVLFSILPTRLRNLEMFLERWGMFILIIFIIFLWTKFSPIIFIAFKLLTGIGF